MSQGADILAIRTGRVTVLIGPPAALGEARGEPLLGREREAAQHIELALEACRDSDGLRRSCARWGLDTNNLFYLDDTALRQWLVAAVRHGHLGVALLPDVMFTAGAVQARVAVTRARIAARIDELMRSPTGAQLARQPDKLIEALQAAARGEAPPEPVAVRGDPPAPTAGAQAAAQQRELTPADVINMALEDRMLELLRRALTSADLAGAVNQDMKMLLDPQTLATAVAVLTAWAATDAGRTPLLVDLALVALGQVAVDVDRIEGLKNLSHALYGTRQARDAVDLNWATRRLVLAMALISPRDLVRLIARAASNPYGVPLKTGGLKTRNKGIARPPPVEKHVSRPAPLDAAGSAKAKGKEDKGDSGSSQDAASKPAAGPKMSRFGDLTEEELAKLKKVAREIDEPIDVVGSTAKGTRRNPGTDLPLGKGEGTKSDLDIRMDGEADIRTSGRASDAVYREFPKGKDVDRILTSDPYPNEPRITVNPDGSVTTHNNVPVRE